MQNFLITSLIASVVLTALINILPMLFPKTAQKAQRKIKEKVEESFNEQEHGTGPRVKVFFPWKTMLIVSLVLTVLVNLIGYFSRGV